MELPIYIIILISTIIITALGAVVGFGTKIMMISVLSFFIGIKEAIVICSIYSIAEFAMRIVYFHEYLNKKLVLKMFPALIVGLLLGLFIFKYADTTILEKGFALFLIIFFAYKVSNIKFSFKLNEKGLGIVIFIFGFLESIIGAAGPLLAIGLLQYGERKENFIVFAASMFIISAIFRAAGYFSMGYFKSEQLVLIILLIVAAILGTYIGKKIINKVSEKTFEYIVLGVMFLVAIKILFFS